MKIFRSSILPNRPLEVSEQFPIFEGDSIPSGLPLIKILSPKITGEFFKDGDFLAFDGKVEGVLILRDARTDETFEEPCLVDEVITIYDENQDSDDFGYVFPGNSFELKDFVRSVLVSEVPLKPLKEGSSLPKGDENVRVYSDEDIQPESSPFDSLSSLFEDLFKRIKTERKSFRFFIFSIALLKTLAYHFVTRWEKVVKMFFGKFKRSLDTKGRLLIPAKLLPQGEKCLYVLRGFDGCLSVYDEKSFEKLMIELQSMDYRNEEQRAYIRLAASSVNEMNIDSHGRILLGRQILDEYGISQDVTIIGAIDHFEIWDSAAFAKYLIVHGSAFDQLGSSSKGNRS